MKITISDKEYDETILAAETLTEENKKLKYDKNLYLKQLETRESEINQKDKELEVKDKKIAQRELERQQKDNEIERLKALLNIDGANACIHLPHKLK